MGRSCISTQFGNEMVGFSRLYEFVPAMVTISDLGEVEGVSKVRINNKPEVRTKRRPIEHIRGWRKILVNAPGFFYCLGFFNCEHFASFIKFEGISDSEQMNMVSGWLTGGLTKLKLGGHNREDLFNMVAYMQWSRNGYFAHRKKTPPKIFQAFIGLWEASPGNEPAFEKVLKKLCDMK